MSTLSTTDNEWYSKARTSRSVKVKTETLTNILRVQQAPQRPGILMVDCEGMDYEVLLGLDFGEFRPTLVVTEEYEWEPEKHAAKWEPDESRGSRPVLRGAGAAMPRPTHPYLKRPVRGLFLYLYLMMDIWSRKVVRWAVHEVEAADLAAALFTDTCRVHHLDPRGIVLHADNGGSMKGATMVVTLERLLGVLASFSRLSVSNDNPFSESLCRTLKYRSEYPALPFADLAAVRAWVRTFVRWYNTTHLHSAIRFVTHEDRHAGRDTALLAARHTVYAAAQARHPARWSGTTRNWDQITGVTLTPEHTVKSSPAHIAA